MRSPCHRRRLGRVGRALPAVLTVLLLAAAPLRADLDDPTRPARHVASPSAQPPANDLSLRAVMIQGKRRFAVVGEQRVEVGDRVAGARVVAIDLASVRLRRDGREIVLTLGGSGDYKQPGSGSRTGEGPR